MFEELQQTMASIFGVPPEAIRPDSTLNSIPAWDSVAHLNLMLRLEQDRGVSITEENILRCISVPGILDLLAAKD